VGVGQFARQLRCAVPAADHNNVGVVEVNRGPVVRRMQLAYSGGQAPRPVGHIRRMERPRRNDNMASANGAGVGARLQAPLNHLDSIDTPVELNGQIEAGGVALEIVRYLILRCERVQSRREAQSRQAAKPARSEQGERVPPAGPALPELGSTVEDGKCG